MLPNLYFCIIKKWDRLGFQYKLVSKYCKREPQKK